LIADQGEIERAIELYQEALAIIPQSGGRDLRLGALAGLGLIASHSGEYGQARRYLEESLDLSHQIGDRRQIALNLSELGRIALAQGESIQARNHFQASLGKGLAIGAPPVILDSLANIGEWFRLEGDSALAVRLATLGLNHPASHARTKEWAGRLLERLEIEMPAESYTLACERGALDELEPLAQEVAERLAAMDGEVMPTSQTLLDPLSERELEILRLVAQGKSNRQIAAELILALGTVKSHLHHIFQKLDAANRTQAVARARELHLL
jgi:ATP/maltotriose-dependent transcriptional regulator MalT